MYLWHVNESVQLGIELCGKYFMFTTEYTDSPLFVIGLQVVLMFTAY